MGILSIQSHVVYGYVGNKAAVFPLQSMGYDVWPVNTVQFSNHTGYGKWQGEIFSKEHIRNIINGLVDIGVTNQCQAILSGYMGSSDICNEVFSTVKKLKSQNPKLLYLCDPVMGNTTCFVKPEVVDFFKVHLTADIITPNQFEAEMLSGIQIKNSADVKMTAEYFHARGIAVVIITGIKFYNSSQDDLYVSISDKKETHIVKTKEYPFTISPNGTGDLFSALFLGNYLATNDSLDALKRTIFFVDRVMHNTFENKNRELMVTSIDYRTTATTMLPTSIRL
jgi:pyridoxine kinase